MSLEVEPLRRHYPLDSSDRLPTHLRYAPDLKFPATKFEKEKEGYWSTSQSVETQGESCHATVIFICIWRRRPTSRKFRKARDLSPRLVVIDFIVCHGRVVGVHTIIYYIPLHHYYYNNCFLFVSFLCFRCKAILLAGCFRFEHCSCCAWRIIFWIDVSHLAWKTRPRSPLFCSR